MSNFAIYIVDVETTGLDFVKHDVIELSIYRLKDNVQKTWCFKPLAPETIDIGALRVNGHKIEDLKHDTKEGRETYLAPHKILAEIENWMMEDGETSETRILAGQNPSFDKIFLEKLWEKCDSKGTFPFGRKMIDTLQIVLLMDLVTENNRQGYSLTSLVESFSIKKEKAHRADADVRMTKDLLLKLMEISKKAYSEALKSSTN